MFFLLNYYKLKRDGSNLVPDSYRFAITSTSYFGCYLFDFNSYADSFFFLTNQCVDKWINSR